MKKGETVSGMERVGSKESMVGVIGCGCQDRDGVAGSPEVAYNAVEMAGVEGWRSIVERVFDTTRGQLLMRPAGLFRTVGRISSSGLYALARFRILIKGQVGTHGQRRFSKVTYRGSWLDEGTLFPPVMTKSSEPTSVGASDSIEYGSSSSGGGLLPLMN